MYQALYRTYRPETFEEVLGQEHIIKILRNQIQADTVSHAYLFCGTRGTGKTTTARLLAKGVNCTGEGDRPCGVCENCAAIRDGAFLDVIEIDAASNNGVENIRELRESVKYPPASGRKKVYIVDEVHMLSTGAFNALLKTLEEPPENVIFILATTEVQKLPATILSRCMRLDFKRVPEAVIQERMDFICRHRGIEVEKSALRLIAANADGSVRDGLSILDQCLAGGQEKISRSDVLEFLGISGEEVFLELTSLVTAGDVAGALLLANRALSDGKDARQFMKDWLAHYRSLLITKFIKEPEDILNMSCENVARMREQSARLDVPELNDAIVEISKTLSEAKWSTQPGILLELCIVKMAAGIGTAASARQAAPVSQTRPARAAEPAVQPSEVRETAAEAMLPSETGGEAQEESRPGEGAQTMPARGEAAGADLDSLWHAIFEDGEAVKGSFNLIRSGTRLLEMGEFEFTVEASSEIKLKYLNDNGRALEELMEKHTGKRRSMKCLLTGEDGGRREKTVEEIAAEAGSKLGLSIEIQ